MENTRKYWMETMLKIVSPVFENLAQGKLAKEIPSDFHKNEFNTIALEAFGRSVCGIAPWLELEGLQDEERELQEKYRVLVRKCIEQATDPNSPDFMNFNKGTQPLVDAAFLAHGILRAPKQLYELLPIHVKKNLIEALKSTRCIQPYENNWLLFASIIEVALEYMGEEIEESRLMYAIDKFSGEWYVGDGLYGDGAHYHFDYYNSFVIQPMLLDILRYVALKRENVQSMQEEAKRRAMRYAAIMERLIMPDGTYPAVGRSLAYRFGAFQLLSQAALQDFLPKHVTAGQVRCALTAVIKKCMEAKNMFDEKGWLQPGLYGCQPELAEIYVNVGSLYLCSTVFLALGLPCNAAFWTEADCDWTNKKIWSGETGYLDHSIDWF